MNVHVTGFVIESLEKHQIDKTNNSCFSVCTQDVLFSRCERFLQLTLEHIPIDHGFRVNQRSALVGQAVIRMIDCDSEMLDGYYSCSRRPLQQAADVVHDVR
jgi:hypothetical protein